MPKQFNRVRGIRQKLPGNVIIGRQAGTTGPAQTLSPSTLANQLINSGGLPMPGGPTTLQPIASLDILANLQGSAASPVGEPLTAILDAVIGSSEGSLIQRGTTAWQVLTPGTSGDVLTTAGPGALNSWQPASGLSPIANLDLLANISGSSANPTGVTGSAYLDAVFGSTPGNILIRSGSGWVALAPGSSSQVLTINPSGGLPYWAAAGGSFNNRGTWNGTAAYSAGDVVQYDGSAYLAYEPVSAPSGAPPSLDGSIAGGFGNGVTSAAVSLTTTNSNDYIIVLVYAGITNTSGISVSSVTGSGLSFTRRGGYNGTDPNNVTHDVAVEEWYAVATGPLTSETITVTLNQACDSGLILAFGVSNATAGFDPNVSLPAQGTGATLTLNTTDAYDFVFYYSTSGAGTNQYQGAPAGYTTIATQPNSSGFVNRGTATYYDTYTSTQSGTGIGGSGGSNYYNFMDALSHGAATNPPPTTDDTHWLSQGFISSVDSSEFVVTSGGQLQLAGSGGGGLYAAVLSAVPSTASTGLSAWLNQGSATETDSPVGMCINAPASGGSGNVIGRYKTAPSTPYTVTALIARTSDGNDFSGAGIGWYDGSNKLHLIGLVDDNGQYPFLQVQEWNSPTSFNTASYAGNQGLKANPYWLQIEDDGTTVYFRYSVDGANFITLYSVLKSSGFLSSYADVIFFVNPQTSTTPPVLATLMSYTD